MRAEKFRGGANEMNMLPSASSRQAAVSSGRGVSRRLAPWKSFGDTDGLGAL